MPRFKDFVAGNPAADLTDDDATFAMVDDAGDNAQATMGGLRTALAAQFAPIAEPVAVAGLALKAPLASPTFTGDVVVPDADAATEALNRRTADRRLSALSGLYLPGTSGVYVSLPDAAQLDAAGDMDVICWVALDDWTPAATNALVAKFTTGTNQRSWYLGVQTDGKLLYSRTTDGTSGTALNYVSTVATGITDGAYKWIKVSFDVNNGSGQSTASFYLSDDGITWTQLGTAAGVANTTATHIGTAIVEIGSVSAGTIFNSTGTFRYASIASTIGGAPFAACNLTSPSDSRQRDAYNNTWTINGSTWAWRVADPFV